MLHETTIQIFKVLVILVTVVIEALEGDSEMIWHILILGNHEVASHEVDKTVLEINLVLLLACFLVPLRVEIVSLICITTYDLYFIFEGIFVHVMNHLVNSTVGTFATGV